MVLGGDGYWGAPLSYIIKASQKSHDQERPQDEDHTLRTTNEWKNQLYVLWEIREWGFIKEEGYFLFLGGGGGMWSVE